MFQSDTIYVILILAGFGLAAYYFADSRSKRRWIAKLEELNGTLRAELKDWQNKALFKHGNTPLGHETKPKPPKTETGHVDLPRVILRGQQEARYAENMETTPQVNIHAERVSYNQVSRGGLSKDELIEQARAIREKKDGAS